MKGCTRQLNYKRKLIDKPVSRFSPGQALTSYILSPWQAEALTEGPLFTA